MNAPPRSVLVIDASPFGESLLALPALRLLRQAYNRSLLSAAVSRGIRELARAEGLADDLIDLGVIRPHGAGSGAGLARFLKVLRATRRQGRELVVDFAPRLETQIVSRLVHARKIVGPSRPSALTDLLSSGRPAASVRDRTRYSTTLTRLGIRLSDWGLGISLQPADNSRFEEFLSKNKWRGGEPLILLYASNPHWQRGWPVESFGELATQVRRDLQASSIAVDHPGDKSFTQAVSRFLPEGAIKLAAPSAIDVAAAFARASVVVTDDSAITRLAAHFSTPVLELADSTGESLSTSHRLILAGSRSRIPATEVFGVVSEVVQGTRSPSLFNR